MGVSYRHTLLQWYHGGERELVMYARGRQLLVALIHHSKQNRSVLSWVKNSDIHKKSFSTAFGMTDPDLSSHDETQIRLLAEQCILVDESDSVVGADTKKNCHLNVNIDKGKLHRAFSVFLFNTKGELLLQQRSSAKITFPDYFTNTCCSHPLYRPEELEEHIGIRRAAQRKLNHELGIPLQQVPPDCFTYLTRILYKARSCDTWGEHEIDYILIAKKDVEIQVNPNEVQSIRYVNQDQLKKLLADGKEGIVKVTPWFRLICEHFLFSWWSDLNDLSSHIDKHTIHNMIR